MNRSFRALQLSLALHVALIAAFSAAGRFVLSEQTPIVIDFRMVDDADRREEPVRSVSEKPVRKTPLPPPDRQAPTAATAHMHPAPEPERTPPVSAPVAAPEGAPLPAKPSSSPAGAEKAESPPAREGVSGAAEGASPEKNEAGPGEGAPEGMRKRYLREHFAFIRDRVVKSLSYPLAARKRGWEGKVLLSFSISGDGSVGTVRVVQSSGREILDQGAVEAVRKASPFPRPPVAAEVVLPVVYRLTE